MIDFGGPQHVPSVNHDYLFCYAAQEQCVCRDAVATAYYNNCFPTIGPAVTGCTIGDATANQFLFTGNT